MSKIICLSQPCLHGKGQRQIKQRFPIHHFISLSRPSNLKEGDFADDGVVDVYRDVQSHFIWQLCQQLLLIWKAVGGESAESKAARNANVSKSEELSLPSMPCDCQV